VEKKNEGSKDSQYLNGFLVLGTLSMLFVNNTFFINQSNFMYTINIFAETLAFLYMAKYFEYDGSQNIAMFMQLGYFHNSYRMVKSVLSFLGADVYDYQNFSLPEMKI
jgi:hypothetical protein